MGGRLKFGPASRQKRTPTIKMLPSQLESSEPLSGCEGVVDASAGACDSRSLLLRNKQKGKNTFAVTLLRANLEACVARRRRPNVFTSTRFSSQSQQKDGSVSPYSTNSSGLAVPHYVMLLFASCCCLLSVAIHTFESLTINHYSSLLTFLFPPCCPAA